MLDRTSLCDGLPFSELHDSGTTVTEVALELADIQSLTFEYRVHRVQARAVAALTQSHDFHDKLDSSAISRLISLFDGQLRALVATRNDTMCKSKSIWRCLLC